MGTMNPLLYKARKIIRQLKKIKKDIFPIEIPNGIYAKPNGGFFKHDHCWKYISSTSIGYLQTHPQLYIDGNYVEGSCGCMLSSFDHRVKEEVVKILEEKLKEIEEEKQ